ncbi:hypothetical protein Pcinc_000861 [Petrolisthes cinctipes]|uniref:Tc1-like transposase DDE domain-containing protein n=1 Tax=Petrolisthes cinctipes TaxID=88211 RepID=A0AAE1GMU1_PETCI|nr:hypothetical protein Pcinc_000861 [Petrolisthes cinctipes]
MIDMAINQAWLLYRRDYETKRIPQEKRHPLLSFRMAVSESLIRTGKIVKRGRPSSNEKTTDPPKNRHQQMSQVRPLMDVRLDKTYKKRLHEAGIHHRRPATKPMLTEKHKEERLGFALQYYPMDFLFWSSVIFCDEKTFLSDDHGELHCWRPNNTRFETKNIQPTRRSGRITAGLWGWMAACGPGELVVIDECLNCLQYIEILEQIMIPSVRALLIPEPDPLYIAIDDSPVHNAAIVTDWFQRHPEVIRIQWPARSPDLMPIENLWSQMVKKWDSNSAKTKVNLVAHAMNIWEAMRLKRGVENICETLVRSKSRRLNSVIECNGSYTKY